MSEGKVINPKSYDDVSEVAKSIRRQVQLKEVPKIGIICGSGLGGIADCIQQAQTLPYNKIPGFRTSNVMGHGNNLLFGYIEGKYVVCMQGRFHPYEVGMDMALCAMPVRVMCLLGAETLIVTNAVGALNSSFEMGDLMLIKDHIFFPGIVGFSPIVGLHDQRFGERFVSLDEPYDPKLRKLAMEVGKRQKIRIHEGVYDMCGGPHYETSAESLMFRMLGIDAVGMSACHEVVVARQMGMRILGCSLIAAISNLNTEKSAELTHEEVLAMGKKTEQKINNFISEIVKNL